MLIKLQERDTMLIDGMHSTLTGYYEFIGQVSSTGLYIVRCADTGALHVVPLHLSEILN
jgi:hypothetical protein